MQAQNIPPVGYKFIEYAETIGDARIILPFGFNPNDTVKAYAAVTDFRSDGFLISPLTWNDANNRFAMIGGYRDDFSVAFGSHNTVWYGHSAPKDSQFHLWTYGARNFTLDGGETWDASAATWGSDTTSLILFYGYANNTAGKIAYYDHRKADGTRYHIVPIQHKETGVVEMYDTVSKTIMQRTGTLYPPT